MLYVCTHVAFTFFNGCVLSKRNALWVNNEMMHSSWADVFFFSMVWLVYFACQNDSITGIGSSILTSRVPLYDPFFFIAKKRKKKQSRRIFYFSSSHTWQKNIFLYLGLGERERKRRKETKIDRWVEKTRCTGVIESWDSVNSIIPSKIDVACKIRGISSDAKWHSIAEYDRSCVPILSL